MIENFAQVRSVYDVEHYLNDGMRMIESDRAKCVEWLTRYMLRNQCSVLQLFDLCVTCPDMIYGRIFGDGSVERVV